MPSSRLLAADDTPNARIATQLGIDEDTARKWRRRFCDKRMEGLRDLPRSGRPRQFSATEVASVKALACELPAESDTPLSKWSCPDLAREAVARGIVGSVSPTTVRRWLDEDANKPWQHRTWIFPRDPNFAAKAEVVLDLYQRIYDGAPLGPDDYVLSSDEKPGAQARRRIHASLPPGPRRAMRVEHEYVRGGTLAYLAAYDVHRAHVIGRCEPTTGITPFTALVDQVMTSEPYASARRVFWIVDNGSSHKGWTAASRLSDAYPNAVMVHTPVHASCQPDRDLLLHPAAQTAHPRRQRRPDHPRRAHPRVRAALQRRGRAVRLAIQPRRSTPAASAAPAMTPDELTAATPSCW